MQIPGNLARSAGIRFLGFESDSYPQHFTINARGGLFMLRHGIEKSQQTDHGLVHRPLLFSNQRDYGQAKSTFDADAQL
jgi:hypothetical protein